MNEESIVYNLTTKSFYFIDVRIFCLIVFLEKFSGFIAKD